MAEPARTLTVEEIARINSVHLLTTPLQPADLLFVFGTRDGVVERIDAAYSLWHRRYCRWLLVSGGMTPGSDLTECRIIKDGLVSRGVPAELILEEHRATNTGENVIFSLPIIEAKIGLSKIRSVICLGNFWTSRRYPMTLHRHWPDPEKMLVVVNHYETPNNLWHTDAELCSRVLSEWDKIEPYKAKGFIAEWP
ncbi:YdcF family protein [Bradyrhizobium cajani]|uniref:YdcF family protein n=1 Tax=Bradyrhizobium cajani TaxID=1928661 RepID=A0A844TAG0_9BRAD|nr:YdcF family protein [Bradyrhizobium cajani]MCP3368483.1 YdcF family protein [Bradyrhizobium cajani]MVT76007.1 YdcF family protein [Bradyrhizobium cajani]